MYEFEKVYLEGMKQARRTGLSRERTAPEKGDLCVRVVQSAVLLGRRMKRDLFVCPLDGAKSTPAHTKRRGERFCKAN